MKTLHSGNRIMPMILLPFALAASATISLAEETLPPRGKAAPLRILVAYYSLTGNTERIASLVKKLKAR